MTSGERRGTILLVLTGALIILAMIFAKGYFKSDLSAVPAIKADADVWTDSVSGDTLGRETAIRRNTIDADSGQMHSRRSHKSRTPRPKSPEGRSRDFLSEPVRTD